MTNIKPKLSFIEFIRHQAFSWDEPASLEWAEEFVRGITDNDTHSGDCTREAHACYLCTLQNLLDDYQKYFFEYDNWKKDTFGELDIKSY